MSQLETALPSLLVAFIAWFAISRTVTLAVGMRCLWIGWAWRHAATDSMIADASLFDVHRPVSVLVPAVGADPSAVHWTLRSLSALHGHDAEVILTIDRRDETLLAQLVAEWDLEEAPTAAASRLPASLPWALLRSRAGGRLLVARTEPGASLSVALGLARLPILCAVSPGATIDGRALQRAAMLFSSEEHVVAVAGGALLLPPGGAGWRGELRRLSYERAFYAGGAGRCAFRARLGDGAPFHLLHRESLVKAGGYDEAAVDPHLDALFRLGRSLRRERLPFRTLVALEPVGRTPLPAGPGAHRRRVRRGLSDALRRHRGALLRPGLGRMGLLSLPWLWCFEWAAPAVEGTGLALVSVAAATGVLPWDLALLGLGTAAAHSLLRSAMALSARRLLGAVPKVSGPREAPAVPAL